MDTQNKRINSLKIIILQKIVIFQSVYLASLPFGSRIRCTWTATRDGIEA